MINTGRKFIPTDVPGLVQDSQTGAILNVDNRKLAEYKMKKKMNSKVTDSFKRIDKLENDVKDIKHMLELILSKVS